MISDVLSDAAAEIRERLGPPLYPYDPGSPGRVRIEALLLEMDALREILDAPAEDSQWLAEWWDRRIACSAADRKRAGDDEQILSLFREWIVARGHAAAVAEAPNDDDDAAFAAACRIADHFEDAITVTPARGAKGLAVKVYISLVVEGGIADDMVSLGRSAINYPVHAGILKDIVRFLPELAPFTKEVVAEADRRLLQIHAAPK